MSVFLSCFVRFHKREYWLPIPHLIYHTNTIVLCVPKPLKSLFLTPLPILGCTPGISSLHVSFLSPPPPPRWNGRCERRYEWLYGLIKPSYSLNNTVRAFFFFFSRLIHVSFTAPVLRRPQTVPQTRHSSLSAQQSRLKYIRSSVPTNLFFLFFVFWNISNGDIEGGGGSNKPWKK